jgi:hypothetical protein
MAASRGRPAWGTVGGFAVAGSIVLALGGLAFLGFRWSLAKVDVNARCAPGQGGRCYRTEPAIVDEFWTPSFLWVSYDDGRRSKELSLRGHAHPAVGAKVILERWDGKIVGVVDRVSERRYRTDDWPKGWKDPLPLTLVALGLLGVIGVAVGVFSRS